MLIKTNFENSIIIKRITNYTAQKMNFFLRIWSHLLSCLHLTLTAQKMKFAIKDFFSKCDQIRRKLRIWSHLLKKSLMENFIFCAVLCIETQFLSLFPNIMKTANFWLKMLMSVELKGERVSLDLYIFFIFFR